MDCNHYPKVSSTILSLVLAVTLDGDSDDIGVSDDEGGNDVNDKNADKNKEQRCHIWFTGSSP